MFSVAVAVAGEDGPGIDQGVLVQMLTVFIVSCPRETTGAANLQEPVLDCFRDAWDSGSVEVGSCPVVPPTPPPTSLMKDRPHGRPRADKRPPTPYLMT